MFEKFQPAKHVFMLSNTFCAAAFPSGPGIGQINRSREFVNCINGSLPGKLLGEIGSVIQAGTPVLM